MDVDHAAAAAAAGGGGRDDGGDRDGRGAAAPSPPNKKRPRHDQGDVLASPDENAHRGRTCVLNEKETAAAAAEERLDDASEWATFERVKKNRAACLQFLVGLTQRIERMWVLADQLDAAAAIGAAADSDTQQQHEQQDSGARCKARDARQRVVGRVLLLRRCLEALEDHKESDLREVARLAQKIKESSIPNLSLKHFLGLFLPIERKFTRGLADHEFLIQRQDDVRVPAAHKIPLVLVLDNLRSAFNVGAIFRTAECFGVRKIFLCGYTATPDEEKTLRTTMSAHQFVPWEWHQRTSDVVDMLTSGRYSLDSKSDASSDPNASPPLPVVALETVEGQPNIYSYTFPSPTAGGFALLLGNERHGIEADLLKAHPHPPTPFLPGMPRMAPLTSGWYTPPPPIQKCAAIVSIPCVGVKNSLNVGVAFGICVYEISRQWHLCAAAAAALPHQAPSIASAVSSPSSSSSSGQ